MEKKYVNEIDYRGFNIVKWKVAKAQYVFGIGTKEFPTIADAKEAVDGYVSAHTFGIHF
jgi:hypothetical protein